MYLTDPEASALPGDVRFRDGRFERFDLADGWVLLDTFCGEYEEGRTYRQNDVVSRAGALWLHTPDREDQGWTCICMPAREGTP
jgi:hypothetical protein